MVVIYLQLSHLWQAQFLQSVQSLLQTAAEHLQLAVIQKTYIIYMVLYIWYYSYIYGIVVI